MKPLFVIMLFPCLIISLKNLGLSLNISAVLLIFSLLYIYLFVHKIDYTIFVVLLLHLFFCIYASISLIIFQPSIEKGLLSHLLLYPVFTIIGYHLVIYEKHRLSDYFYKLAIIAIFIYLSRKTNYSHDSGSFYQFISDLIVMITCLMIIKFPNNFTSIVSTGLAAVMLVGSRASFIMLFVSSGVVSLTQFKLFIKLILFMSLVTFIIVNFGFLLEGLRVLNTILGILSSDAERVISSSVGERYVYHLRAVDTFEQHSFLGRPWYYHGRGQYAHSFMHIFASWGIVGAVIYFLPLVFVILQQKLDASILLLIVVLIVFFITRIPEGFVYGLFIGFLAGLRKIKNA